MKLKANFPVSIGRLKEYAESNGWLLVSEEDSLDDGHCNLHFVTPAGVEVKAYAKGDTVYEINTQAVTYDPEN